MISLSTRLNKSPRHILGLMSGTSLDGLDIALVSWKDDVLESFTLEAFSTFPYPDDLQDKILQSIAGNAEQICTINFTLGHQWARNVGQFLETNDISPEDITCIGSHGQTIWHISGESTLQLGESAVMAAKTGIPVVSNFREHDIALGGTGAPLIPYLDWLMYRKLSGTTIALNLGGIANITCIEQDIPQSQVIGWDTGPGNMVVNTLVHIFSDGGQRFDIDGKWAMQGNVNSELLESLLETNFVSMSPPKSTGRELYSESFVREHFHPESADSQQKQANLVATAAEWTVASVAQNVTNYWKRPDEIHRVIVGGGGVHNQFFMQRLESHFPNAGIVSSEELGVPVDAKESLGFAVFARAFLEGIPANLPGVTGAKKPVVLGKLTI